MNLVKRVLDKLSYKTYKIPGCCWYCVHAHRDETIFEFEMRCDYLGCVHRGGICWLFKDKPLLNRH